MTLLQDAKEAATPTVSKRRGRKSRSPLWMVTAALLILLTLLILIPCLFILFAAFNTDVPRPGNTVIQGTIQNLQVLLEPGVIGATLTSVMVAATATVLALSIGGFLAFVVARTDIPLSKFVYLIGLVPLFLPSYVGALAWSVLGSPGAGLFNIAATDLGMVPFLDMYSMGGLIFVLAIYYAPYAFLLIYSSMSLMNPDMEDAAAIHGSSRSRMLREVSFPLSLPAILGSGLMIFILTFENFPVAQVLASPAGINTLPTYIYRLMNSLPTRGNEAAVVAVVLVAFVLLLTWVQKRVLAKRSYVTVSGKGMRPRQLPLGKFRWVAFWLAVGYFVCTIVLPLAALFLTAIRESPYMSSFSDLGNPGALNFAAFGQVLQDWQFWEVTQNSVLVSLAAAVGGTILAFLVAYVVYRTKAPLKGALEGISMMPLAVPAIVLGIGLMWTWLIMPIPLYGTLAVMVVAFVAAQMPQGFRSIAASIQSTDRDLEDSAVMLGASRTRAIITVTVPLMKTALASCFLILLMLSMRELTVPLFLYTNDTKILSIHIFDLFENGGSLHIAAATSLVYCLVMFVLSYLPRRFGANDH